MANNKGSTTIEAVIMSVGLLPLIGVFLISFIWLSIDSYVDHQLDEHLLCLLENKSNCLNSTLKNLQIVHITVHHLTQTTNTITIKGSYLKSITFNKKRSLQYDKNI